MDNSTLIITAGATVNNSGTSTIGNSYGSTGLVTVSGTGSTWNTNNIYAGILYVGNSGNGILNVTGGGAVSDRIGWVAYDSGSTGVVTVDGTGSTWSTTSLRVGYSGTGTLNITNGGCVLGAGTGYSNAYVGYNSNSRGTMTVSGPGSTFSSSNGLLDLYIGYGGAGTASVTNGGNVSSETRTSATMPVRRAH